MMNDIEINKIFPSEIKEKYNYLKIGNKYIILMSIVSIDKVVFIELLELLYSQEEMNISFYVNRQKGAEFLRRITRFVSESGAELKSIKSNQIDLDLIEKNKKEAEELKKEVQVNNEEIYLVEMYVEVAASNEEEVQKRADKVRNLLYTRGIFLRQIYFKQKIAYVAALPLLSSNKLLSNYTENIMLTSSLALMFPFFVKENQSQNGVYMGISDNKPCKLSLLANNNLNYNMCVFGSSGVGKSFFVKLLIIRNLYENINQIIIDLEGEYKNIVLNLGGNIYELDTYNPLYIAEDFAKSNVDFLTKTIDIVLKYIEDIYDIQVTNTQKNLVKELYLEYGITESLESLYDYGDGENIYIFPKYKTNFPLLKELLKRLNIVDNYSKEENTIKSCKIHCFYIKGQSSNQIKKEVLAFMPKIKQLIEPQTLIYFDEIWKLISLNNERELIEEIYNFFKTLRKRNAGIIAISQDIGDLFNIDNGAFGKSILNNSHTKVFFKMSYADMEKFQGLAEDIDIRKTIYKLSRGEAYIIQGESKFILNVRSSEFEKELIESEEIYEEDFNSDEQ